MIKPELFHITWGKRVTKLKTKTKVLDSIINIHYREGELENLLRVRDNFVNLIQQYSDETNVLSRSKLLGSIFDTVFLLVLVICASICHR